MSGLVGSNRAIMLRNLLVRSFSACGGDAGREGWERRRGAATDQKACSEREGGRWGGFLSHLARCPFFLALLSRPLAVLGRCRSGEPGRAAKALLLKAEVVSVAAPNSEGR